MGIWARKIGGDGTTMGVEGSARIEIRIGIGIGNARAQGKKGNRVEEVFAGFPT